MLNLFYKNNGSVMVFLSIIMVPILILTFGVVDFAKTMLAYNALQQATDLTINSALASYNKALKDAYGIFAISEDMATLKTNMSDYYLATLAANGITDADSDKVIGAIHSLLDTTISEEDLKNNNFIKLYTDADSSFDLSGVNNSQVSNPLVLKRQIVEFMKYRGPIEMVEGIFSKLDVLQDLPNQAAAAKKKIEYGKAMQETGNAAEDLYKYLKQYITNNQKLGNITDGFKYKDVDPTLIIGAVPRLGSDIVKGADNTWPEFNTKLYNDYLLPLSDKLAALAPVKDALDSSDSGKISSRLTNTAFNVINTTNSQLYSILSSADISEEDVLAYSESVDKNHFVAKTSFFKYAEQLKNTFIDSITGTQLDNEEGLPELFDIGYLYGKEGFYSGSMSESAEFFLKNYCIYTRMFALETFVYDKLTNLYAADDDEETLELIEKYEKIYIPLSKQMLLGTSDFDKAFAANEINQWHEAVLDSKTYFDTHYVPLKTRLIENSAHFANAANKVYAEAKSTFKFVHNALIGSHEDIKEQLECLEKLSPSSGKGLFSDIKDKIKTAQTKSSEWSKSTDSINNAQMKADAKGDHSAETQFLDNISVADIEAIEALISYRKAEFKKVLANIEKYTLFGKTIYDNGTLSEYKPKYVDDYGVDPVPYAPPDDEVPEAPYYREYISEIEDTDFFKFLKQMYESAANDKAKETAEKKKEEYANEQKSGDYLPKDNSEASLKEPAGGGGNQKSANDGNYTALSGDFGGIVLPTNVTSNTPKAPSASGDNTEVANGASDMLSSSIITTIGNLASSIASGMRDNIYMTEYITEFFSCQTTNYDTNGNVISDDGKKEKTLTLRTMDTSNNYLFGSEVEYILYGFDSAGKNRAAATASVFGIRFALNLVYSFTDGEINATTSALASAIGGALPFLIPIIKVVLHVVLSLTETTLDIQELLVGKAVPIYKSTTTWRCKTSNIVKEVALTVVETTIDYAADKATDKLLEMITKLEGDVNDAVIEQLDGMQETVNSQLSEIQERIRLETFDKLNQIITESVQSCRAIVTNVGEAADSRQREEITRIYNRILDQARNSLPNDGSVYSMAAEKLISAFDGKESFIIDKISEKINEYTKSINDLTVENEVLKIVTDIENDFDSVFQGVRDKVSDLGGEIKKRITSAVSDFAEKTRGFTEEKISGMKESLKESISGKISNFGGSGNVSLTSGGGKTSISDLISMTYKDYLYIFLLIGTTVNENDILKRTAKLMQLNVNHAGDGLKDADFRIGNAYTILNAKTQAKIDTFFLGIVFKDGHPVRSPEFDGKYEFSVSMNMGY